MQSNHEQDQHLYNQYLAFNSNNNRINFDLLQQQQQFQNSQFLKLLPKFNNGLLNLQQSNLSMLSNNNSTNKQINQPNLFQTLIAANILRSNIQNTSFYLQSFAFKNSNIPVSSTSSLNNHLEHQIASNRKINLNSNNSKRFDYSKLAQECSNENDSNNHELVLSTDENKFQNVKSYKYYKNNIRLVILSFYCFISELLIILILRKRESE